MTGYLPAPFMVFTQSTTWFIGPYGWYQPYLTGVFIPAWHVPYQPDEKALDERGAPPVESNNEHDHKEEGCI